MIDNTPKPLDRPCIADGITSCISFQIRNESDWEKVKKVLNEEFYRKKDVLLARDWFIDKILSSEPPFQDEDSIISLIKKAFGDMENKEDG